MRPLLLAGLLFLVMACAPEPLASPIREAHPASIAGSSWRIIGMGGAAVPPQPEMTIDFADGRLAAQGPCNAIVGSALYDPSSGALRIGDLVTTKRACLDPNLARVEAVLLHALGGSTAVSVDPNGHLVLSGPGVDILLDVAGQEVPVPSQAGPS